eukprot:gene22887-30062_t
MAGLEDGERLPTPGKVKPEGNLQEGYDAGGFKSSRMGLMEHQGSGRDPYPSGVKEEGGGAGAGRVRGNWGPPLNKRWSEVPDQSEGTLRLLGRRATQMVVNRFMLEPLVRPREREKGKQYTMETRWYDRAPDQHVAAVHSHRLYEHSVAQLASKPYSTSKEEAYKLVLAGSERAKDPFQPQEGPSPQLAVCGSWWAGKESVRADCKRTAEDMPSMRVGDLNDGSSRPAKYAKGSREENARGGEWGRYGAMGDRRESLPPLGHEGPGVHGNNESSTSEPSPSGASRGAGGGGLNNTQRHHSSALAPTVRESSVDRQTQDMELCNDPGPGPSGLRHHPAGKPGYGGRVADGGGGGVAGHSWQGGELGAKDRASPSFDRMNPKQKQRGSSYGDRSRDQTQAPLKGMDIRKGGGRVGQNYTGTRDGGGHDNKPYGSVGGAHVGRGDRRDTQPVDTGNRSDSRPMSASSLPAQGARGQLRLPAKAGKKKSTRRRMESLEGERGASPSESPEEEDPPNTKRLGPANGLEEFAASFPSRLCSRQAITTLQDDGKKFKRLGDKTRDANNYKWTPSALTMYLHGILKFLEAAHGYEQLPDRDSGTCICNKLLLSLHSILATFLEAAHGYEQLPDRDSGTRNCCKLLLSLHSILATVQNQSDSLLRLANCIDEPKASYTSPEQAEADREKHQEQRITLEAIRLLRVHEQVRTKWLVLNTETLQQALTTLESGANKQPGGTAAAAAATAANAPTRLVGDNTDGAPRGPQAPAGDSASSTLDAANAQEVSSWTSNLEQVASAMIKDSKAGDLWQKAVTSAMIEYSKAGDLWQKAAEEGQNYNKLVASAMIKDSKAGDLWQIAVEEVASAMIEYSKAGDLWQKAAEEGQNFNKLVAERQKEVERGSGLPPCERGRGMDQNAYLVTAAQIEAMGYEAGVWDLMGTVHVARKVLESITNLPGCV